MRVLITGAAGFLGSHLAWAFLNKGYEVIGVDDYITGLRRNITDLETNNNFSFIFHDVIRPLYVREHLDGIFHLACPASPVKYLRYPIETLEVSSKGTHNLLNLAKAKGCGFLLASTSEVYGDPKQNPQTENYWGNVNPVGPRSVYDEGKRYAEALTVAYGNSHNVPTMIARIFNTYGPRMRIRDGRVVPNFIQQALKGKPLTVYGDGSHTRSFCYVDDTVDGLYALFKSKVREPVNIGNPNETKVGLLAKMIVQMTGSTSSMDFLELPQDDPQVRNPDISKAKSLLGWSPKISLEKGLRKTIDYYQELTWSS